VSKNFLQKNPNRKRLTALSTILGSIIAFENFSKFFTSAGIGDKRDKGDLPEMSPGATWCLLINWGA
jgi:hypothetical protein